MLLPFGDTPNIKSHRPWMNYAILAANILIFAVMFAMTGGDTKAYSELMDPYAYRPSYGPTHHTLLTSLFMHAGFMHLASNMLFLWIFGDNVEARLGHVGYLVAYLVAGAAATLVYAHFAPESASDIPLVGASGAISGVQGMYLIACPKNKVKLLFLYLMVRVFHVSALIMILLWFALQDGLPVVMRYMGKVESGDGGGVAHMAHIGGFVAGLIIMAFLRMLFAERFKRIAAKAVHDAPPKAARPVRRRRRPRF